MNLEEMKRIKSLLFQATNEKKADLIENYIADIITFHDGCSGENGEDVVFEWKKEDFINGNILAKGGVHKNKSIILQLAEGNKVFTLFTVEFTHDAEHLGYPPTGKKIRYNAQYTARFENGMITEIWATMDGHTLLKQMGAAKGHL